MWGWNIERDAAYALLDAFYDAGYRWVDCATNYPITGRSADWRLAERWLAAWVRDRGVDDLRVLMKVGSVDNRGGRDHDLGAEAIAKRAAEHREVLGPSLAAVFVHWDPRRDAFAIRETASALGQLHGEGLRVGWSGLAHPEVYASVLAEPEQAEVVRTAALQVKHALLASDRARYAALEGVLGGWMVYGIHGGGLKPQGQSEAQEAETAKMRGKATPAAQRAVDRIDRWLAAFRGPEDRGPVGSYHDLALLYALSLHGVRGVICGPRTPQQLAGTLERWRRLAEFDGRPLVGAFERWRRSSDSQDSDSQDG